MNRSHAEQLPLFFGLLDLVVEISARLALLKLSACERPNINEYCQYVHWTSQNPMFLRGNRLKPYESRILTQEATTALRFQILLP